MNNKEYKVNNVDELAKLVVSRLYLAEIRWELFDRYGHGMSLRESSDDYHHIYIMIPDDLAKEIEGIWTKKLKKYIREVSDLKLTMREFEMVGRLTIPGILKRLGYSGLKEQIAQKKASDEVIAERNRRNSSRIQIQRLAEKILSEMDRVPVPTYEYYKAQLTELVNMELE